MALTKISLSKRIGEREDKSKRFTLYNISLKDYLGFISQKLSTEEFNELYQSDVKTLEIRDMLISYGNFISWVDDNSDFFYNKELNMPYLYLSENYLEKQSNGDTLLLYRVLFEPLARLKMEGEL